MDFEIEFEGELSFDIEKGLQSDLKTTEAHGSIDPLNVLAADDLLNVLR